MRRQLGLGVLLMAAALAGCAESGPTPPPAGPGGPVTSSSPSAGGGDTSLTIVVDDGATTWRLTCGPPGGDHPDPAAACAALEQNAERALPPVGRDKMCTQQYGGDRTATITGSWRGAPVQSRFSLTNGCEIDRWTSLAGLLPPVDD